MPGFNPGVHRPRREHPREKRGKRKPKPNKSDRLRWFPGPPGVFSVHRRSPGRQRYHPASPDDVRRFVQLIPGWQRVADDLDGVLLCGPWSAEYYDTEGLYGQHGIVLFSWPKDPRLSMWYAFTRHVPDTIRYLGLKERKRDRSFQSLWTPAQARAYVLLFVLLHEIGHHVDWVMSRDVHRRRRAGRGEPFAEDWAAEYRHRMWDDYVSAFGPVEGM